MSTLAVGLFYAERRACGESIAAIAAGSKGDWGEAQLPSALCRFHDDAQPPRVAQKWIEVKSKMTRSKIRCKGEG